MSSQQEVEVALHRLHAVVRCDEPVVEQLNGFDWQLIRTHTHKTMQRIQFTTPLGSKLSNKQVQASFRPLTRTGIPPVSISCTKFE